MVGALGASPPLCGSKLAPCSDLVAHPGRYQVTVEASSRFGSVVSEAHLIKVQERIVANRLLSTNSALVNTSVAFECRISFGTEVTYRWDFGDGTVSLGSSSSSHIYHR